MTSDELKRLKKICLAATRGEWVFGEWDILEKDRPAQKRKEPYWTLKGSKWRIDGLMKGPLGRKALDTEYIIRPCGWETDGIAVSEGDMKFISNLNPDTVLKLIEKIERLG